MGFERNPTLLAKNHVVYNRDSSNAEVLAKQEDNDHLLGPTQRYRCTPALFHPAPETRHHAGPRCDMALQDFLGFSGPTLHLSGNRPSMFGDMPQGPLHPPWRVFLIWLVKISFLQSSNCFFSLSTPNPRTI